VLLWGCGVGVWVWPSQAEADPGESRGSARSTWAFVRPPSQAQPGPPACVLSRTSWPSPSLSQYLQALFTEELPSRFVKPNYKVVDLLKPQAPGVPSWQGAGAHRQGQGAKGQGRGVGQGQGHSMPLVYRDFSRSEYRAARSSQGSSRLRSLRLSSSPSSLRGLRPLCDVSSSGSRSCAASAIPRPPSLGPAARPSGTRYAKLCTVQDSVQYSIQYNTSYSTVQCTIQCTVQSQHMPGLELRRDARDGLPGASGPTYTDSSLFFSPSFFYWVVGCRTFNSWS